MAGFKVSSFRGLRPRISARKLPAGEAQTAENVRLGSGDLRPWYKAATDQALDDNDRQTIHLYDNDGSPIWFEWDTDVDVARGPVKDDTLERVYYTDGVFPKMTYRTIANTGAPYPSDHRRLGLPAPSTAPAVTATAIAETTVGNTLTLDLDGSDTMTSNHFYLTILNSIWEDVNGVTAPEDERVYVKEDLGTDMPIDIGIEVGAVYTVTVVDEDNFTLTNPDSDYLSKSSRPTSPRDGSTGDTALVMVNESAGGANFAGYIHAPNAIEVTKTAHGLFNNSQVIVRSIAVPPRWRYETGATATPSGSLSSLGSVPYFLIDYPDTGPYPSGPDNTELTTHECTFNDAGDHFDIYGNFTIEVIDDGDGSTATIEERAYVYTWVTALGEEGPPSPVSTFVEVIDGETVTIDTFDSAPGSGDKYDIDFLRIYRTNVAADPTEDESNFQFVAELAIATSTYDDEVLNEDLGELLPSANWDRPDPNMRGIVALSNGMMAGFYGKNVYLCEPYFPHAWPAIYDQAVDYEIVAIVAIGTSAVVLTTGWPYILTGTHPRNVSLRPYKVNQACVSKRSAVEMDDRAVYASPDGLVMLGIDGYKIITEEYFDKDTWQERSPTTIVAEVHDDKYFAFHTDGGFVFDPRDETIGFSTLQTLIDQTLSSEFFTASYGWSFSGGQAILTDGSWVIQAASGNDFIISTDGITWIDTNEQTISWEVVAYSDTLEKFVALRLSGVDLRYQTSVSGESWTTETTTTGDSLGNACSSLVWYADFGLFVLGASEADGDHSVMTSPDGVAWTARYTFVGASRDWAFQAYSPTLGRILLVSPDGAEGYIYSDDAINWTAVASPYGSSGVTGILWHAEEELFLMFSSTHVRTSADGITWSSPISTGSISVANVEYNSDTGRVIGTSTATINDTVVYSDDGGATWDSAVGPRIGSHLLKFGGGVFLAIQPSSYATKTSPDGLTWTNRTNIDAGTAINLARAESIVAARDIVSDTLTPISEGETFTVSATIESSGTGARVGIAWYDSGSSLLDTDYADDYITSGVSTYTGTAPASAAFAAVVVSAIGDSVVTGAASFAAVVDTHLDIENDVFYYSDGSNVYEWEGNTASKLTMDWKSGQFHMPYPVNMGAAIVEASAYPITFYLYGDGELRATRTVSNDEPFRLPGGYLASTYEVEIEGDETITEVKVAENIWELAEG